MTIWNSLRSTFVSALHHPRLWLLQFFGNVAIVLVFAFWLNFHDQYWWNLFFSIVVAVILIVVALMLHGGTLDYWWDVYENKTAALLPAFRRVVKHLPAFAVWVVIFLLLLQCVGKLNDYQYQLPGYLRSKFPAWLRRQVTENGMDNFYAGFVGFLGWVVVPGFLLPLGLRCANSGFAGFLKFRAWLRTLRNLSYWIVLIAAGLIAVYCNTKIMGWTLHPAGAAVTKEAIWLGFRMLVAYLFGLFSWLWVCSMLARASFNPDPPAAAQKVAA